MRRVKGRRQSERCSYQRLDAVLLLHLLPQLLEAGLQPLVEGPQRLRHLLPVDAHAFSQVRDLEGERGGGEECVREPEPNTATPGCDEAGAAGVSRLPPNKKMKR